MKHLIFITSIALAILAGSMWNCTLVLADDLVDHASVPIYIGTYTHGNDGAKGIYLTRLNTQDGRLSDAQLVAEVSNPAFLAKHPTQSRLYAVTEHGQGDGSPIHAFAIDPVTHALTKLNEQSVPAFGACHLGVFPLPRTPHEPGKCAVMVAFYNDGATASLPLTDDGQLDPYISLEKHEGSGPTSRQTQAHAHAVHQAFYHLDVLVPDLGADKLIFYHTTHEGKLDPYGALKLPPGSGPRHAVVSHAMLTLFILNELNSTICVTGIIGSSDFEPANMGIYQTISTLPEGKSAENNFPAEIFLHPNGRFLYASNRGDDSIALFRFNTKEFRLEFVETTPCGRNPRSFDISPDGKWLIVAALQDDQVKTFRIDPDSGRLSSTGHAISVKQPACVLPVLPEKP
ncbi:MAG: lactonase family protein [Planctomycetaceae bacterium]|nr:lactonase family protein [Planctomycetaceae bacterium]